MIYVCEFCRAEQVGSHPAFCTRPVCVKPYHCHIFHDDNGLEAEVHRCQEFDCKECGRHIFLIAGPLSDTCGACQCVPGWFLDPEIARVLDPDYRRRPRAMQ